MDKQPVPKNASKMIEKARRDNDEKFKNSSKKRLITNIEKKFKTLMIGALAAFEESFGEVWGHGNWPENPTEEQKIWRDEWEKVRTKILNSGNNQLRAALDEIAQYTMTWNRYRTEFIIKQD